MGARQRMIDDIRAYEKKHGVSYRLMHLRDTKVKKSETFPDHDIYVECDFSKPWKIAEALLPYQSELLAITCRYEQSIARFAAVIPHVPYLRTPTPESLAWAADKYEMRKRLNLYNKKISPRFTRVKANTIAERARVIEKVKFPMIIKPTSMVGSLFVSICYHEDELERTLSTLFRKIRAAYSKDGRLEEPKVIAEEFMEGDLYSLDSYVDSRGKIYHCPLVRQKTAREIGREDFYNYLQITPSALKPTTVERARQAAEDAIHALGLRAVTAHIELMKLDDEWKVVEVGPRTGGLRDQLHGLSCDIGHTMNDILIRIPKKPLIPKKCKGYAAYYKYYCEKEGEIVESKGIKKIEELESIHTLTIKQKNGDRSVFAKNGGRPVFTAILYNQERSQLLADIRRIEKLVNIKVADRANKTKSSPRKKSTAKKKSKTIRKKSG
jgi:hypothetical protein